MDEPDRAGLTWSPPTIPDRSTARARRCGAMPAGHRLAIHPREDDGFGWQAASPMTRPNGSTVLGPTGDNPRRLYMGLRDGKGMRPPT